MKKAFFVVCALLMICACNTNYPTDKIYAPITQEEEDAIRAKINKNWECVFYFVNKAFKLNCESNHMVIEEIGVPNEGGAMVFALDAENCFGDTYAYETTEVVNGRSYTIFHLKQRIYCVTISVSGKRNSLWFDKDFNLIGLPITDEYDCGCDCWEE